MPLPNSIPRSRLSALGTFRRIMKLTALFAIAAAAIAVLLVARGGQGPHIHMMIATALGAGLSVLLAGALMSLVFLSARSGHDAEAGKFEKDEPRD